VPYVSRRSALAWRACVRQPAQRGGAKLALRFKRTPTLSRWASDAKEKEKKERKSCNAIYKTGWKKINGGWQTSSVEGGGVLAALVNRPGDRRQQPG